MCLYNLTKQDDNHQAFKIRTKSMQLKKCIAFVMRYHDNDVPRGSSTIEEHNAIILKKGRVWVGKYGVRVSEKNLEFCKNKDYTTKLILVKSAGLNRGYDAYISNVIDAKWEKPNKQLIPSYYHKRQDVGTWFCINKRFKKLSGEDLLSWIVKSSRELLVDSLHMSMSGFFVAIEKRFKNNSVEKRDRSHLKERNFKDGDTGDFTDFFIDDGYSYDSYKIDDNQI